MVFISRIGGVLPLALTWIAAVFLWYKLVNEKIGKRKNLSNQKANSPTEKQFSLTPINKID